MENMLINTEVILMAVNKNTKTNTWEVRTYYKDWSGERKQKTKRGFKRKADALEWERNFKLKQEHSLDMKFADFVEIYKENIKPRLKENTWQTKEHIIRDKILPYFGERNISDIKAADIVKWQNEMMQKDSVKGKPLSETYLKTINNQLSAILNHAVNFYGLSCNEARKAGSMGKKQGKEMLFWTQEEFQLFIDEIAENEILYYAFEVLYWCGIRLGELLALTMADFDFEKRTLTISKSYQRINREDVITTPKTEKSNRTIVIPNFLCEELKNYFDSLYGYGMDDRIFPIGKSTLHHYMKMGAKAAGVKRIRIHDLRHSHVSLLINMGYQPLAIADRIGHEAIEVTYRYAHLFPTVQNEIADKLDKEREAVRNEK